MATRDSRIACGIRGCKVTVSRKIDLIRHGITHTRGPKLSCCDIPQNSNLICHLRKHHSGNKKYQCTGPGCDWGSDTKVGFPRHYNQYHGGVTASSSALESTIKPASYLDTTKTPATHPHLEDTTSLHPSTAPPLLHTIYDGVVLERQYTADPSRSWNRYAAGSFATASPTDISTLQFMPTYNFDLPSSSSNIPYGPNVHPDGIQAQSPPIPDATRHGEHLIWAPSTQIGFQQYASLTITFVLSGLRKEEKSCRSQIIPLVQQPTPTWLSPQIELHITIHSMRLTILPMVNPSVGSTHRNMYPQFRKPWILPQMPLVFMVRTKLMKLRYRHMSMRGATVICRGKQWTMGCS
ncbi:uncharacterized protein BT62DRAFT_934215 [Guyanagaster necrorhizus]|uniref:C2H2-type domain-containing protein n=1 Tax=Guyanagaster necrorhizus TaxID=856835 RepID=A0A9P8AQX2_9AGAR|nr:uncharacterized protein BT62DRAFT_934215 [Guyanagaster necrorhizus MCA 3950]KAG7444574.1 hypothetical protein BT62DRAFT_934215 [Guyanagaster necrorhizus MCA 3950]